MILELLSSIDVVAVAGAVVVTVVVFVVSVTQQRNKNVVIIIGVSHRYLQNIRKRIYVGYNSKLFLLV